MHFFKTCLLITVINIVLSELNCLDNSDPLIIAHRGACGMYPEHTALAYREAIEQGADYIECDVEVTKDLELVCSHEQWLSDVIDKHLYPEFSDRQATYTIMDDDPNMNWNDKGEITDWFTFDFTLAELKTIKRIQRLDYRDPSFNNKETFVTFQEYIDIAKSGDVGIYPEFKSATFTNELLKSRGHDTTIYDLVLQVLVDNGYEDENSNCFLQTFERSDFNYLKDKTNLKRLFLMGNIFHEIDKDPNLLEDIREWSVENNIDGFGINKNVLVAKTHDNHIKDIDGKFVEDTHAMGQLVHIYTLRNEYMNMEWDYGQDPYNEYDLYLSLGIDGYFSEFPQTARQFLTWKREETIK